MVLENEVRNEAGNDQGVCRAGSGVAVADLSFDAVFVVPTWYLVIPQRNAMTGRSRAREVALQLLFWRDFNPRAPREIVERFVHDQLREKRQEPFCLALFDGVCAQWADLDRRLGAVAQNWRLPRMAAVDRNVLRLGGYELLCTPETPPRVVLDEAIELARRYGSADSPGFVNGVLDRLLKNAAAEPPLRAGGVSDG